jgi:uncharacterized damage-inducible protein DinB
MEAKLLFEIYSRDLNSLKFEIQSYSNENLLWLTTGGINNSAGNLCLHILGNLNHFIGNTLGNSGYVRNRDAEFSQKNIPAQELIQSIDQLIPRLQSIFEKLKEQDMENEFPLEILGKKAKTSYWLVHFACHLNYHLGQINYHRRILSN